MKANNRRPDLFIVGAPKSGTTSLYQYLKKHPDVYMSPKKEPNYFSTDLKDHRHRTEQEYLQLFADAPADVKRLGEASTTYLFSADAPKNIIAFSPNAHIVIILRNPVDMIYSLHAQNVRKRREDLLHFTDALEAEPRRRLGKSLPPNPPPTQMLLYRELGKYTNFVNSYLTTFGRDRVKVIIFEEFKAEPEKCFKDLCGFLDLNQSFRPDFLVHNPNKEFRSRWIRRLPKSAIAQVIKPFIAAPVRHRIKRIVQELNYKIASREPMDLEVRRTLEREYMPEADQLSDLLQRDLTSWWQLGNADSDSLS